MIKNTIQFAIRRCKPLADYIVHHDGDNEVSAIKSVNDTGHCLIFSFTGTSVTFGKDKIIFYDC